MNAVVCKLTSYVEMLVALASVINLTAVSIERLVDLASVINLTAVSIERLVAFIPKLKKMTMSPKTGIVCVSRQ